MVFAVLIMIGIKGVRVSAFIVLATVGAGFFLSKAFSNNIAIKCQKCNRTSQYLHHRSDAAKPFSSGKLSYICEHEKC